MWPPPPGALLERRAKRAKRYCQPAKGIYRSIGQALAGSLASASRLVYRSCAATDCSADQRPLLATHESADAGTCR